MNPDEPDTKTAVIGGQPYFVIGPDERLYRTSSETRFTDPDTGGQKGAKSARYDLMPWEALEKVAELYGKGAEKYNEHNWRKGYPWSMSFAALMRHATQFWEGEEFDNGSNGTGCHHLTAVVFHALALLEFTETHPEKDDRYATKVSQKSHSI